MSADEWQLILEIKSAVVCFFVHGLQSSWVLLLSNLVAMVISPPADVFLPVASHFIRIILQSSVGEAKMYPSFN